MDICNSHKSWICLWEAFVFEYTFKKVFLKKQPVYKQLALGWQIASQLSGLNPLSLSNNKNCWLKKSEFFLCTKRKIATEPTMHQNSVVSKAFLRKFSNHWSQISILLYLNKFAFICCILKITVFPADIG